MTDLTVDTLRTELAPIRTELATIRTELATIRPVTDGIPLIHRAIEVLRQEVRSLRAAFNDFAITNVTAGEIQALHSDVNAVQSKNAEIEIKIATLQRQVQELQARE